MKIFNLPDLGEGLPDAEIVEWTVAEGDNVNEDAPMVSMETAKAVVEVPCPFTGKILELFGQPGDVIETGAPLVSFQLKGESVAPKNENESAAVRDKDSGTVVGKVERSDEVIVESSSNVGGVKVTPAVRAIARKLGVDLEQVTATGAGGVVTAADVRSSARRPTKQKSGQTVAAKPAAVRQTTTPKPAIGYEPVRGARRSMARMMANAHANIVPTTLFDEADIHSWRKGEDIMVRLIRALVSASKQEPSLNAWYDSENNAVSRHAHVDIGMAIDTQDGLFVPALRQVQQQNPAQIRAQINRRRDQVLNREIPPEELTGYTIMLSNFGKFAGRFATPVIAPPCVAILAVGKLSDRVVAVDQAIAIHRLMPLSLTFDHRAATGGEAARFLAALLEDLSSAQ